MTRFFSRRSEALLGHVTVWDKLIGRLNLVQALRVGVHHDQHHDRAVRRILGRGEAPPEDEAAGAALGRGSQVVTTRIDAAARRPVWTP